MGYLNNSGLSFETLRAACAKRVGHFKNAKGEPAHSKPDGSDWSPAQWLQATVGELGEYANIRKKYERGDITYEEFVELASEELADVQIYFVMLADQLKIDLAQAVIDKFNKVSVRVNSPVRLRADDWYYHAEVLQRTIGK